MTMPQDRWAALERNPATNWHDGYWQVHLLKGWIQFGTEIGDPGYNLGLRHIVIEIGRLTITFVTRYEK